MRHVLLAIGASLVMVACASQPQPRPAPARPALAVEQVKRSYQFCDKAECPAWTPKTIVVEPPAPRPAQTKLAAKKPPVVTRHAVQFKASSSMLDKAAKKVIADAAKDCGKQCVIEIFGYAEKGGSPTFKVRLATVRASVVEKEFLRLGIEKKVLHAGVAEGCCTKNPPKSLVVRRVEVVVTGEAD